MFAALLQIGSSSLGALRNPLSRLRNGFLRDLFTVMFGTVAAQAFSIAFLPVLSRVFKPADFGVFGSFGAVLSVLGAGATLQYSQALMLPKEDREARHLLVLSCFSAGGVAFLSAAIAVAFPGPMARMLNAPGVTWVLWVLPVAVLINGVGQAMQAHCVRHKAFRATSGSQVVRSVAAGGSQAVFGILGAGGGGLVNGFILGDAASGLSLWFAIRRKLSTHSPGYCKWADMLRTARRYADFPLYATPQNIMNAASQGLPVLLLAQYFGAATAGLYAIGVRVLQAPMNLVLTPLRQVLFQRLSEAHNAGEPLFPHFCRATTGLVAVCAVPVGIGFILAPQLFALVLGSDWLEAGVYARWLFLWLGVLFCNTPSVLLARILRQQRNLLVFDALLLLTRVAALVIGGVWLDPLRTIILFSIVGLLANSAIIVWIALLTYRSDQKGRPK